jgi:WXG100 family type VII secretion target
MEKTLLSIQIDFGKARTQADQLDQLAGELKQLAGKDLEDCMIGVAANWKGKSAASYVKKGRKLEQELEKAGAEIEKIAQTLRQTAETLYNAEKQALLLQQKEN